VIAGDRDADNDGIPNSDDTCPFTTNVGSPYVPGSGDAGEVPLDGIDAACDNVGVVTDVPGFPWDATGTCRVGTGDNFLALSCDGDGFPNRNDNCPQHANDGAPNVFTGAPTLPQSPESEAGPPAAVDGGPETDGVGDACDLNLGVADGHFHKALLLRPVCITGGPFSDLDLDGWCDATEGALGNADLTGTPENILVPTTCDNGVDDDLDGFTNLADSGCQLPPHDIELKKVKQIGNPNFTDGATVTYKALINWVIGPSPESVELGILVDAFPGAGCSGPTVSNVTVGTVTGSGPINIDGDNDVEWLTKVVVPVSSSTGSSVHFDVTYPAPCAPDGPVDYVILADACHQNDIAPLGLFGAAACGASATGDGGMDTNSNGNDSPIPVLVDVQ